MVVQATDGEGASPFHIVSAKSLPERRLRTLKLGDAFAVLDPFGDIPGEEGAPEGVYRRDTRLLSTWCLLIAGTRPLLLGSAVRNDNAFLSCDLTNADLHGPDDKVGLPRESLYLRRVGVLGDEGYAERLVLRNFGRQPVVIAVEYRFAADFADLFEVRGQRRERRGEKLPPEVRDGGVRLAYRGLDGVERVTRIGFEPAPAALDDASARHEVRLEPGGETVLHASVGLGGDASPPRFDALRRQTHASTRPRPAADPPPRGLGARLR